MTHRNITKRPLTELQKAILDLLWSEGPASAERVREALRPRYPLKDSSVRTLLRRLETRGLLTHCVEGKVFLYQAAVAPRRLAAGAVRSIIDRFCAGSAEQFLTGLVDEKVLSMAEIRRLARRVKKSS